MQRSLFEDSSNILPFAGEVNYYEQFFSPGESDHYFNQLLNEINWKQEPIKIFGKEVMQPRLTAWYGNADKSLTYSGITMHPERWTDTLLELKQKIEPIARVTFTSALLNLYRDGRDSVGWHRDNEKQLGANPVIGSLSFGATRKFQLRNYKDKKIVIPIDLTHGSFLLMQGETQHHWEHQLPKTNKPSGKRINITFRVIVTE